tara:strand:+ start:239 stop:778 length:540 start_codon:yes stop_codon:yes gene_type:complete
MGLKRDLVEARIAALKAMGVADINTAPGSPIDIEMTKTTEAIVKFLLAANFRVTEFKAPIIVEDLKTPDQPVNIKPETLLGEYGPVLSTLRKLAKPLGFGSLIDSLASQIQNAVRPLTKGGADLVGLNLHKASGKLESTGYTFIGEDPETQEAFDVTDEGGQREFTKVKLIRDDIEELL